MLLLSASKNNDEEQCDKLRLGRLQDRTHFANKSRAGEGVGGAEDCFFFLAAFRPRRPTGSFVDWATRGWYKRYGSKGGGSVLMILSE